MIKGILDQQHSPLEGFWCIIQQRISVQLHPVALPRCHRRLSPILEHCLATYAALHQAAVGIHWEIVAWNDLIAFRFEEWNGRNACIDTAIDMHTIATARWQFIGGNAATAVRTDRWLIAQQQWIVQQVTRFIHLTHVIIVAYVGDTVAVDERVGR